MSDNYGATRADWDHLSFILGLTEDLLPVVSNPKAKISPQSSMKGLGKTPSQYNRNGLAVGVAGWTDHKSTNAEIDTWAAQPDLGICLQTRTIRAIDIDIDDPERSSEIEDVVTAALGPLPTRRRSNSGKCLMVFSLPGDMPKRKMTLESGIVEFLATGQQFIACGTHTSGVKYQWDGGLPLDVPVVSLASFDALWVSMANIFATSAHTDVLPTKARVLGEAVGNDDTAVYLRDNDWVKSIAKDGRMHIRCPFEEEHTGESAESATTYFPAHTGGYAQGHFACLHAHCSHREDDEFRVALGIRVADSFEGFFPLPDESNPDMQKTMSEAPEAAKAPRFKVVPAHEFADHKPPGWVVKNVLPKAGLAVVYGESGSGKSFWALDICAAIARGEPWRGNRVQKGKVAYVCAEGAGGMRSRLRAYSNHTGVPLQELDIGVIPDAPNFMQVQDVKDLILSIQAFGKTSVVVVDTFAQVMSGANENAGEDVGKALEHCRQIHKYTGALVVLIHHSGKDSSKGARGWSGLRAAADAEIEITRNEDAALVTKMKDGADGAAFGFKLVTVKVCEDEDKEDITSCVVEESKKDSSDKVKTTKGSAASVEKRVLDCLEGTTDLGEERMAYTDLLAKVKADMVPPAEGKRDTRDGDVKKAVEALQDKKSLVLCNGFVSLPIDDTS